jgi:hypothetical protein
MTSSGSPAHDFDFWVGEWSVVGPEGRALGTSSISPLFGTGAIAEHWRGTGGFEGRSLSGYDADRGCWHQTWVDSSGGVLMLDGRLQDGAMVLEGRAAVDESGVVQPQRVTWTPEEAGVRQHWETSADGTTWTTVFDGHYRRTAAIRR